MTIPRPTPVLALLLGLATTAACSAGSGPAPPGTVLAYVSLSAADPTQLARVAGDAVQARLEAGGAATLRLVDGAAGAAAPVPLGPDDTGVDDEPVRNDIAREARAAERAGVARTAVRKAVEERAASGGPASADLVDLVAAGLADVALAAPGPVDVVVVSTGLDRRALAADGAEGPTVSIADVPADRRADVRVLLVGLGDFGAVAPDADPDAVAAIRAYGARVCAALEPLTCRVLPRFPDATFWSLLPAATPTTTTGVAR